MHRREFLSRAAILGCGATCATPLLGQSETPAKTFPLKVAGYAYDRVRAIMDGRVGIEGTDVSFSIENIYTASRHAFGPERKYEVTEIGLLPFLRKYANEEFRAYKLVPVFISRTFRHRNIFVHADSGIEKPEDLRGRRVGTPGYGFSASVWIRGFLLDEYGVKADEMDWIETTDSSDGGKLSPELDRHFLPDDFPLVKGPSGVDESELLLSGSCDALISPITPIGFLKGDPKIRRLFPDYRATERAYFRKTGIFPIMHAVAVRSDAVEQRPSLPKEVCEIYQKAKQIAYDDLETTTALKVSLPWVTQEYEDTTQLMGKDFWRYGIKANLKELHVAMRYAHEQGLVKKRIDYRDLFYPSTLEL